MRKISACMLSAAILVGVVGCSNLIVKKVPVDERVQHRDDQQGFRYYLNRPYLAVKKPIFITEKRTLVKVDQAQLLTYLEGPMANQTVALAELQVNQAGSSQFRKVTDAELNRIQAVLKAAPRDDQVAQAQVGNPNANDDSNADPSGFAAATADSLITTTTGVSQKTVTHQGDLTGNISVIYLPDLDEQYVVRSKNVFAKSAFSLVFRNGGELVEVDGDHDSTTVAISLLSSLQNAIGAVQKVEAERIREAAKSAAATPKVAANQALMLLKSDKPLIYEMIEEVYIKPGVYRLNKPWEAGAGPQPVGCGLLVKLGLPTVTDVKFQIPSGL